MTTRPRTLLICHDNEPLNRIGLARWMASWSDLAGIVVIREPASRLRQRVRREVRRVGWLRFLDVMAFRMYYRLALRHQDQQFEQKALADLTARFPELPDNVPVMETASPNTPEVQAFIANCRPDLTIARCKTLLKKSIFSIPRHGTFVMHPGICPQYRNAHGCFWAMAMGDWNDVGLTLLQIDEGIDTGPIFGFYRPQFDPTRQTHIEIQEAAWLQFLPELEKTLLAIFAETALPLAVTATSSKEWGQPWLSAYFRIRRQGRQLAGRLNTSTKETAPCS